MTKKDIITQAFDNIGLSSYDFDMDAGQYQSALDKLDTMIGQWHGRNMDLRYVLPTVSIDEESGLETWAEEAVILNLALRIAPSFGKQLQIETKQFAKQAYTTLLNNTLKIKEVDTSDLPIGSGYKITGY